MIAFFEWFKHGWNGVLFIFVVSFLVWMIEDIIEAIKK